jgi:hypothetical protein
VAQQVLSKSAQMNGTENCIKPDAAVKGREAVGDDFADRRASELLLAWAPLVVLPLAVMLAVPAWLPRWVVMWLMAGAIYWGAKWLSWRLAPPAVSAAPLRRKLIWWLLWPGMDPEQFMKDAAEARPMAADWLRGFIMTFFGVLLFYVGGLMVHHESVLPGAWCAMFGMAFVLHYGTFHILSCIWRAAGYNARPITNKPLSAASVGDFWGHRWNLAFRDACHAAIFRPYARRWGARTAMAAVFLFSGLIHELAVSYPAQGGWGLPTLYFVIQLAADFLETSPAGQRLGLRHGIRGRVFALAVIYLPLPILFHPPFASNVIAPFVKAVLPV